MHVVQVVQVVYRVGRVEFRLKACSLSPSRLRLLWLEKHLRMLAVVLAGERPQFLAWSLQYLVCRVRCSLAVSLRVRCIARCCLAFGRFAMFLLWVLRVVYRFLLLA